MPGEADRRLDAAAESYLDAIARELASADLPERQRGELLANVRELLTAGASPAAVGAAEDVVSAYAEAADGADGARDPGGSGVWDPASGRLLAPKPRGGGSNLAWGGIAARPGLLRPDDVDEDVLAAIPDSTMAVVRWLPAGFAAASLAAAEAIRRRRIRVPLRASLAGRIKSSASPAWGAALIAVPAAALGSVSVVPAADRMTLLTRSARIASLNAGILASALLGFTQRDGRVRPSAFLALTAASVCVEGAVLLLATKAGLRRVAASDGAASDEGASSREGGRP